MYKSPFNMGMGENMIKGKVASILSPYQLVLSIGVQDGVSADMTFVIFEEGDEILDPDSGESIGRLEMVKGEVRVTHVQATLTLVESLRKPQEAEYTVLSERMADVEVGADEKRRYDRDHIKLNVSAADVRGVPSLRPIRVGDWARSTT